MGVESSIPSLKRQAPAWMKDDSTTECMLMSVIRDNAKDNVLAAVFENQTVDKVLFNALMKPVYRSKDEIRAHFVETLVVSWRRCMMQSTVTPLGIFLTAMAALFEIPDPNPAPNDMNKMIYNAEDLLDNHQGYAKNIFFGSALWDQFATVFMELLAQPDFQQILVKAQRNQICSDKEGIVKYDTTKTMVMRSTHKPGAVQIRVNNQVCIVSDLRQEALFTKEYQVNEDDIQYLTMNTAAVTAHSVFELFDRLRPDSKTRSPASQLDVGHWFYEMAHWLSFSPGSEFLLDVFVCSFMTYFYKNVEAWPTTLFLSEQQEHVDTLTAYLRLTAIMYPREKFLSVFAKYVLPNTNKRSMRKMTDELEPRMLSMFLSSNVS